MPSLYDVAAEAQNDLFEIWRRIAEDSVDLANRINSESRPVCIVRYGCRDRGTREKTSAHGLS
jgi:hypothetical protein